MLRFTGQWMGVSVRGLTFAAALVLSIAVPNLSMRLGFAGDESSQPPTREAATLKKAKAERPPFDLIYVPADAMGVIAVRPNIIFSDPAMRPLARMANEAITGLLPVKIPADLKLPVEEIEQVIGYISITPNKRAPKGVHTSGATLTMIRVAHDYDWQRLMRQLDPKGEEIRREGQLYCKVSLKSSSGNRRGTILWCAIPDKHTLVLVPGPGVLQEGQAAEKDRHPPCFSWHKDWKQVERGLFAAALDNRWARGLSGEQIGGEPWANSLTQHVTTMVAGVDWKDGIDFQAFLSSKDPASAKQAIREVKALVAGMGQLREATIQVDPGSGQPKAGTASEPQEIDPASLPPEIALQVKLWKDLVTHARVTRRESTVCVHTTAKIRIADFVKAIQFYVGQDTNGVGSQYCE